MDFLRHEYHEFVRLARESIAEVRHGIRRTSWHHILLAVSGACMAVLGGGGQIISINQWLAHFPVDPTTGRPVGGPYSVLLTSSLSSLLLYLLVSVYWFLRYRPSLACLKTAAVWVHCGAAGLLFAMNGFLVVFATAKGVDEILQAILISSQIIWTLLFSVIFRINHGKNYCHVLVIASVVLSIVGILLGTLATQQTADTADGGGGSAPSPKDNGVWAFLFALGVVPGALTNVVAARFLQNCAYDEDKDNEGEEEEEDKEEAEAVEDDQQKEHGNSNHGDDDDASSEQQLRPLIDQRSRFPCEEDDEEGTGDLSRQQQQEGAAGGTKTDIGTAKVLFLLIGTFTQVLLTLMMMPLDWAPFFGVASDSADAIQRLDGGLRCIFNTFPEENSNRTTVMRPNSNNDMNVTFGNNSSTSDGAGSASTMCASNSLYFALFALCFALTNSGNLIISQFSAPLTSMVNQVATPATALLIELFPKLSPSPVNANVAEAVFAVIFIFVGAGLFSFWEELTSERIYVEEHHHAPHSGQQHPLSNSDDNDGAEMMTAAVTRGDDPGNVATTECVDTIHMARQSSDTS